MFFPSQPIGSTAGFSVILEFAHADPAEALKLLSRLEESRRFDVRLFSSLPKELRHMLQLFRVMAQRSLEWVDPYQGLDPALWVRCEQERAAEVVSRSELKVNQLITPEL
jgi:hypothetical protein